jgi:hypothetical protein
MGKRGLGVFLVRGNRRVPRPAAKIIAFIPDIMPARKIAVKEAAVQRKYPKILSFVVPHVSIHKMIVTLERRECD